MLGFVNILPSYPTRIIDVLRSLGLSTNLKLCLDAGDLTSYPGSGQTWFDLSGNANNVVMGNTTSSEAFDPTFSGTAGRQSAQECFTYSTGNNHFTLTSVGPNPTWVHSLHKPGTFGSWVAWINYATTTNSYHTAIFGTGGQNATDVGTFAYMGTTSGKPVTQWDNGTSGYAYQGANNTTSDYTKWNFIGMSYHNVNNATAFAISNANTSLLSPVTNNNWSSANATSNLQIGCWANNQEHAEAGSKIAGLAIWSGTQLSQSQMLSIYYATRGRFQI